jgi:hypothetical protein
MPVRPGKYSGEYLNIAGEGLGHYKLKQHKPWFYEEC